MAYKEYTIGASDLSSSQTIWMKWSNLVAIGQIGTALFGSKANCVVHSLFKWHQMKQQSLLRRPVDCVAKRQGEANGDSLMASLSRPVAVSLVVSRSPADTTVGILLLVV